MTVPNAEWDSSERESNNLCLDDESFFRFVKQRVNTKNEAQTNLRCFEKLLWILHVPLYEKRHHSTKTGHLFLCQLKLWIWLKSWRWNKIKMSNRGDSYFTVKYVERTQRRGFESSIGLILRPHVLGVRKNENSREARAVRVLVHFVKIIDKVRWPGLWLCGHDKK